MNSVWQKLLDIINDPDVREREFPFHGYVYFLEKNDTGCCRAVMKLSTTNEDKAFFSSRQTALEAYTAALTVQDYNANIIKNIEKVRLELLQFITKKKEELGLADIPLDFDGNVYFIQISHGPRCKHH